ncbi:MAG TPA: DUF3097 family protein [Acidimicrobiales bacterium]
MEPGRPRGTQEREIGVHPLVRTTGYVPGVSTRRNPMAGILAGPIDAPPADRLAAVFPTVPAVPGMSVAHRASGFNGVLVRIEGGGVEIRGRTGLERVFHLAPGAFSVGGRAVTLIRPAPPMAARGSVAEVTASGSVAVPGAPARVARAGRVLVEGVHDAELVERVWGDDLRIEGVVVERLDGLDHLASAIQAFRPGPARRLGVLVDHLIEGSKESRIAAGLHHPDVLVTGTPFVDVWQAVKPAVLGIDAWPHVGKGVDWKSGVCEVLGFGDAPTTWRRILSSVRTYADLEPALVGSVERLIDFVTDTT